MYKIAFIDDQVATHDLFRKFSENEDLLKKNEIEFKMFEENNPGNEAISKLCIYNPHLLFLDLYFEKGISPIGLALIPIIKQRLPNLKIVLLSNEADIKNIKKVVLKSADGYIYKVDTGADKPNLKELIEIIKELISGARKMYFSPTIVYEIKNDLEFEELPSYDVIIENFRTELELSKKEATSIVLWSLSSKLDSKIIDKHASRMVEKGVESYKRNNTNLYKRLLPKRETNMQFVMNWVSQFKVLQRNSKLIEKIVNEIIANVEHDPDLQSIINENYGGVSNFLEKCKLFLNELYIPLK